MDDEILDDDSIFLKRVEVEELSDEVEGHWRRFELSTANISQEFSQHLRLVIEPMLGSKLQGDYRTGKRINMKMGTSPEYFSYYYQHSEFEAKSCASEDVDFSQCIESCENDYTSYDEVEPNRKKNRNDMSSYMELSRYPFVLTTTLREEL